MSLQIENIPLPRAERAPPKLRKKTVKVTPSLKKAAKEYKQAYVKVYGLSPRLTFDGKWIRLPGNKEGVSIKRLRELTTQLLNRVR